MKINLHKSIQYILAALLALLFAGCNSFSPTNEIPPVADFDVKRYMGKWYEIARLPHNFESNVTDAQAVYTLLDDGTIVVENSGISNKVRTAAHAVARPVTPGSTVGELEVSFFYPFYTMYKIIYLDKDYTLAIVTGNSMDYLWILSRKPVISSQELAMCLKMVEKWGYAVKLLQYPNGEIAKILTGTLPNQSK